MYFVLGGGGKVGEAAAKLLLAAGHEVAIVESDKEHISTLCEHLTGRVMVIDGDCCDTKSLVAAGIMNADVYCALSGHDDDNLASCEIASALYRVPRNVARVNDPRNERIFVKMGIETVSSTTAIANMVQSAMIMSSGERNVMPLAHDGFVLMEVQTAGLSGGTESARRVSEIDLPEGASLLARWADGAYRPVSASTLVPSGATVLVAARPEDEPEVRRALFDL